MKACHLIYSITIALALAGCAENSRQSPSTNNQRNQAKLTDEEKLSTLNAYSDNRFIWTGGTQTYVSDNPDLIQAIAVNGRYYNILDIDSFFVTKGKHGNGPLMAKIGGQSIEVNSLGSYACDRLKKCIGGVVRGISTVDTRITAFEAQSADASRFYNPNPNNIYLVSNTWGGGHFPAAQAENLRKNIAAFKGAREDIAQKKKVIQQTFDSERLVTYKRMAAEQRGVDGFCTEFWFTEMNAFLWKCDQYGYISKDDLVSAGWTITNKFNNQTQSQRDKYGNNTVADQIAIRKVR